MQAIILATDEQRSLSPLTDTLPAPMLPIVDRPVMAMAIELLARAGQKQVLMSLYERGGQIASYFGEGRRWGVNLKPLIQRQGWGSAGSLRFAASLLNETVLVLPGDAIVDLDIEAALAFHRAHGGMATAIVHGPVPDSVSPTVQIDAEHKARAFAASGVAPEGRQLTGAFVFEPGVLRHIPPSGSFEIASELLPALLAAGEEVYCYEMPGYWNPLSSIAAFQSAQKVYLDSAYRQSRPEEGLDAGAELIRFPSLDARQVAPGIWVGRDHSIHPSVKLAAPIYIGANSWIGREVELGPRTVIGPNVVIDDEATISHSTVLGNTYIGRLVRIDDRVVTASTISDAATGVTTYIVDPFLIGKVGAPVGERWPLRRMLSVLGTVLLLALLSPLLFLVWLVSMLATGGQPIVRQIRVSQRANKDGDFRSFHLLHFRTRRSGGGHVLFGKLLERLEFHRLPELFNVLKGELALVGVKPLSLDEVAGLKEEWHQRRHDCPAGFTGLWYVQLESSSDVDAVIVTDVYYAATRTGRGDLLLLLRTPLAWMRRVWYGQYGGSAQEYHFQADNAQSL
jgi:NDP-sugar pyrophosphorylase family protein/lipopolysaccharide/colanic/teichoic acid biosynthesis glycosyltransferase